MVAPWARQYENVAHLIKEKRTNPHRQNMNFCIVPPVSNVLREQVPRTLGHAARRIGTNLVTNDCLAVFGDHYVDAFATRELVSQNLSSEQSRMPAH